MGKTFYPTRFLQEPFLITQTINHNWLKGLYILIGPILKFLVDVIVVFGHFWSIFLYLVSITEKWPLLKIYSQKGENILNHIKSLFQKGENILNHDYTIRALTLTYSPFTPSERVIPPQKQGKTCWILIYSPFFPFFPSHSTSLPHEFPSFPTQTINHIWLEGWNLSIGFVKKNTTIGYYSH